MALGVLMGIGYINIKLFSFNNRQGIPYSHGLKEKDIVGFVVLLDAIDPPTTKETKISESLILTFINGDYCGIMYKGIPA